MLEGLRLRQRCFGRYLPSSSLIKFYIDMLRITVCILVHFQIIVGKLNRGTMKIDSIACYIELSLT
jgi:hypothetical protein